MNREKFKIVLLLILATWLFVGCAGPRVIPVNPSNPIRRVAILPMLDNSDDVDAPTRVREEFFNRLSKYHYEIQPLQETTDILNQQMGISMGKQLDMATPQDIGKTLGVDGIFYGYLLDFEEVTVGVANTYKVRMGWKLVDIKTGKISWGKGVGVRRTQSIGGLAGLGSNEAEKVDALPGSNDPMNEMPGLDRWISMGNQSTGFVGGLVSGIGGKLVDGITGNSLKKEIDFAFNHLFPGMLIGPGSQVTMVSDTKTQ